MDNKEAIKELSEWLDGCCGGKEIEPTRQALRLAISALQAQDSPKPIAESVQNVQNEDLILRKAAIDAIEKNAYRHTYLDQIIDIVSELPSAQPEPLVKESRTLVNDLVKDTISRQAAIDVLGVFTQADALGHTPKQIVEALPSAQPKIEERTEEFAQNVPKEDLISRNAAIDALAKHEKSNGHNYTLFVDIVSECAEIIRDLPSAQPEIKPISYQDCANAMMIMWMDDVLTDGEYRRIMDKLNDHESRRENR